jgi:serpin B
VKPESVLIRQRSPNLRARWFRGNCFFSPFSVRAVLMMLLAGARGETAVELRTALRLASLDDGEAHREAGALIERLESGIRPAHTLHIANSLWLHENYATLAEFNTLITERYRSMIGRLDFSNPVHQRLRRPPQPRWRVRRH